MFRKIYPNDVCPCKSGKKYKHCCKSNKKKLANIHKDLYNEWLKIREEEDLSMYNSQGLIYPDDECPCGSREKYIWCCRGKEDKKYDNEFAYYRAYHNLTKEEKLCLYNIDGDCNQIIKAHTIQNNKILKKLEINEHVYCLKEDKNEYFGADLMLVGRNDATTARCFCKKHDTEIFKNIELQSFERRSDQIFMYAYRAFSKSYYDALQS